jgi:hypothetical protein
MLRIEQVVANLFGCGGRLGCVWDWHRDGNRQNAADQRLATLDYLHRPILSRVRCIGLFACAISIRSQVCEQIRL